MQKLNDPKKIVDTKKILASGPAPTLIYLDSLNRLIDDYIVITEEIEKDEDARKSWVGCVKCTRIPSPRRRAT